MPKLKHFVYSHSKRSLRKRVKCERLKGGQPHEWTHAAAAPAVHARKYHYVIGGKSVGRLQIVMERKNASDTRIRKAKRKLKKKIDAHTFP